MFVNTDIDHVKIMLPIFQNEGAFLQIIVASHLLWDQGK